MSLPNSNYLKGVGLLVVLFGLVEIGVGGEVWAFVPGVKYGSWWAAIFVVLSGLVALIASNKLHLQVLMFLSSAASILSFSGMLVDSFGYRRVNDLETCVDTDTGNFVGSASLQPQAAVCAQNTGKLCACVSDQEDVCHNFEINKYREPNCDLILNKYTDLLLVSVCFTTFCLALVFFLSVIACTTYSAVVAAENPAPAQVESGKFSPVPAHDVESSLKAENAPAEAVAPAEPVPMSKPEESKAPEVEVQVVKSAEEPVAES